MEFLATYTYPHPIPGEIVTAVVAGAFAVWAIAIAIRNFGPGAPPPVE